MGCHRFFYIPYPEEILTQRERFEFIVAVEYEKCLYFCRQCNSVGHDICQCKLRRRDDRNIEQQRRPRTPVNSARRAPETSKNTVMGEETNNLSQHNTKKDNTE